VDLFGIGTVSLYFISEILTGFRFFALGIVTPLPVGRQVGDKGSMTVAQFLEMTADDRKVVR
jgi:hypothetical protein